MAEPAYYRVLLAAPYPLPGTVDLFVPAGESIVIAALKAEIPPETILSEEPAEA